VCSWDAYDCALIKAPTSSHGSVVEGLMSDLKLVLEV
jgi:hypothetical protein